ncbi:MAG: TerB family tellurite resistance protein [Xenococcus sp. MO_188.B8]|nr:TerB family tellurite resistance protein [Xenococcus sp. MO_188.B8]
MAIAKNRKNQKLFQILVGAAWIDGVIQPQERTYLQRIAQEWQLNEEPEIKIFLSELKAVQPTECYLWLEEYLENYPGIEDYYELLEKVGGLIYCDEYVDIRETRLLEKLQSFDPRNKTNMSGPPWFLRKIRKFYQKVVQEKIYS